MVSIRITVVLVLFAMFISIEGCHAKVPLPRCSIRKKMKRPAAFTKMDQNVQKPSVKDSNMNVLRGGGNLTIPDHKFDALGILFCTLSIHKLCVLISLSFVFC